MKEKERDDARDLVCTICRKKVVDLGRKFGIMRTQQLHNASPHPHRLTRPLCSTMYMRLLYHVHQGPQNEQ